jgi:AAA ATPase domain
LWAVATNSPSWRDYEMLPRPEPAVLCCSAARRGPARPLAQFARQADEGAPPFWPWRRILGQGRDRGLSAALLEMPEGPPAAARFATIERSAQALLVAAQPAGLVVILDDLQWADDASLRLLQYLRGDLPGSRMLIVGAARDVDEALARLQALVMRLPPLTEADVAAYLASAGEVAGSWPAYVHARTGGNPLFVRELTRVLMQQGRLAGAVSDVQVPANLRRMAGCRLDGQSRLRDRDLPRPPASSPRRPVTCRFPCQRLGYAPRP